MADTSDSLHLDPPAPLGEETEGEAAEHMEEVVEQAEKAEATDGTPASETRSAPRPPRATTNHGLLAALVTLASIAFLVLAKTLLVPIVGAFLLFFLLKPGVRVMRRAHVPAPLGAAVMMVVLVVGVLIPVVYVVSPAAEWMDRAPQAITEIEQKLSVVREPLAKVTAAIGAIREMGQVAETRTDPEGEGETPEPTVEVQESPEGMGLLTMLANAGLGVFSLLLTLVLAFFLLASGNRLLERLVEIAPNLQQKKEMVVGFREAERDISYYLMVLAGINTTVALFTAFVMWTLGFEAEDALFLGLVYGILNFIPYIGALTAGCIIVLASILSFDTLTQAVFPPLAFGVINMIEAYILGPIIYGGRLAVNPVMILLSLSFFGWAWGIPGALMAVPLLVIFRIVCNHVASLKPLASLVANDTD